MPEKQDCPAYRQTKLSYLNGFGSSPWWDYLEFALKAGVIEESGGWLSFQGERVQGRKAFHDLLVSNRQLFETLRDTIGGEKALAAALVDDGLEPSPEDEEKNASEGA